MLRQIFVLFLFSRLDAVKGNQGERNLSKDELVEAPYFSDFHCGSKYIYSSYGELYDGEFPFEFFDGPQPISNLYLLNETVKTLKATGYQVEILNTDEDAITNITYTDGKNTWMSYMEIPRPFISETYLIEEIARAQYMARLGKKIGDEIDFVCEGVLINLEWVLSAAHCFGVPEHTPNIVRLGDYDLSEAHTPWSEKEGKFIVDYPIENIVLHPEYSPDQMYHDLSLIQLRGKLPFFKKLYINPICLPWKYVNHDFVNEEVVLTGWGNKVNGGNNTNLLHKVHLKVFNASVCHNAYSNLSMFSESNLNGMSNEYTMCVGWEEDGKHTCNSLSGAPIAYDEDDDIFGFEKFTLVGTFSRSIGCDRKEYPGLFIPVTKTKYLRWIKEVAFKNYN